MSDEAEPPALPGAAHPWPGPPAGFGPSPTGGWPGGPASPPNGQVPLGARATPPGTDPRDPWRGDGIAGAGAHPGASWPAVPAARARRSLFGPPPPPRRPHKWGLGAYLLVEAVFLLASAALGALFAGSLSSSAGAIALALSVPTVLAAALAVLITQVRGNGPRIDLGLQFSWHDVGVGLACGLAGLVITIPASVLYVAIVGQDATSAVGEVFGEVRAGPALAVTVLVIVVFIAPLCEEIVYRGLLWGAVERLGANRWWTLAITTLVFALAHFEFTRTPLLLVVAIPIGVARVLTGRLTAGVIAHQINNLLPGVILMLGLLGVVPLN